MKVVAGAKVDGVLVWKLDPFCCAEPPIRALLARESPLTEVVTNRACQATLAYQTRDIESDTRGLSDQLQT